jgi:hypothetical protein
MLDANVNAPTSYINISLHELSEKYDELVVVRCPYK